MYERDEVFISPEIIVKMVNIFTNMAMNARYLIFGLWVIHR